MLREYRDYSLRLADADDLRYSLMYCLRALRSDYTAVPSINLPSAIDDRRLKSASNALAAGVSYKGIFSAFTSYSRGDARAELEGNHTIRFWRDKREIAYDYLSYQEMIREYEEYNAELRTRSFSHLTEHPSYGSFISALRFRDWNAFDSKLPPNYISMLLSTPPYDEDKDPMLPSDWSFRGISIKSFRSVWRYLRALSSIQQTLQRDHIKGDSFDMRKFLPRTVNIHSKSKFKAKVANALPGLDIADLRQILDLLTLDQYLGGWSLVLRNPSIATARDINIRATARVVNQQTRPLIGK